MTALYLDYFDEQLTMAVQDAESLQINVRNTMTRFTMYLRRLQLNLQTRRIDTSLEGTLEQKSTPAAKLIDSFNRANKQIDALINDIKLQIPTNTTIVVDEPELPAQILQPILKKPASVVKQVNKNPQTSMDQFLKRTEPNSNNNSRFSLLRNETSFQNRKTSESTEKCVKFGRLINFKYTALRYDTIQDFETRCAFCNKHAQHEDLGPLYIIPARSGKKYTIHEMCALWSQNLVFYNSKSQKPKDPENLDQEVEIARLNHCLVCGELGANLRCKEKCDGQYHFLCLMKSSVGQIIPAKFAFKCDSHKKKKSSSSSSKASRKQMKLAEKAPSEEDYCKVEQVQ